MRTKGRGLTHPITYAKRPFCHVLCNIFACKVFLLSYVGDGFLYLFCETFTMIIFLSFRRFTVVFSMDLLVGYLKAFPLEMGGSDR